jgi:extracellular factor (EF) 3-hydroxypalmitic acid methyl ester biosynthesis protein
MACGPAKEVQDFIIGNDISEKAHFDLLDFNDETLNYTEKTLEALKRKHGRGTSIKMVKKSVNHILKESFKGSGEGPREGDYDVIYCAGLFDYLEDRICKRMMDYFYDRLAPGGLLMATNVTPSNPFRNVMESFMEWHLIYRDHGQMADIKPGAAPDDSYRIETDVTGVNIFIEVRKPK